MKLGYLKFSPIIIALILPLFVVNNTFYLFLYSLVIINVLLALSYNLTSGYLALDNLAIGGLAGMGGYVNAYLLLKLDAPFPLSVLAGGLVSAAIGIILVYPSLRIKGVYFAVVTIIVQLILTSLYTNWTAFTNGDTGVTGIPSGNLSPVEFVYALLLVLSLFVILMNKFTSGSRGLKLAAIHDDEMLATGLGIDVTRQKLLAFSIASFVTGISGAFLASLDTIMTPGIGDIFYSFNIFTMVYLGGRGGMVGPILGASILTALPNVLQSVYPYRQYINGALLILVAMFLPSGLTGLLRRIFNTIRKRNSN